MGILFKNNPSWTFFTKYLPSKKKKKRAELAELHSKMDKDDK